MILPPPIVQAEPPTRAEQGSVQRDADTESGGRRFGEWMAEARRGDAVKEERPERAEAPDEDPQALLAELELPAWMRPLSDPAASDLAAGDLATGRPPAGALAAGASAAGASAAEPPPLQTADDPAAPSGEDAATGDAQPEAPTMFELEVETEPAKPLRHALEPRPPPAPEPGPVGAHADPSANPSAPDHVLNLKAPEPPALPPAPTPQEYVPALKQVRVMLDRHLSLEVSPSHHGDAVSVRLDGTPEALRHMVGIESELREGLQSGGFQLGDFSSDARGEGEREARGPAAVEGAAPIAEDPRRPTHDGLVSDIA